MRRKNYMVAGDELTTVSGQGGIGDIASELTGEIQQASDDGRRAFNAGMRQQYVLSRRGFEPAQPEQPAAQATQADEDELVQRARYGRVIRVGELDALGPEASSRAMNRIMRGEGDPSRQTITSTSTKYAQANQAIRGMLARRNANRAETRGSYPGDTPRGAIETGRQYRARVLAWRKEHGMGE